MTLVGKSRKRAERLVNLLEYTICGDKIVGCDVFPDFVQVAVGLWVEDKSGYRL